MYNSAPEERSCTVREATIRLLRDLGLTTIFGNPGSTELPLFRNWPVDFRYILGLQEASVVAMADGYAQATRHAALVNLHSAVGVGHALGNIFTAYRNQTPLVITAGQQARSMLLDEPYLWATQATEFPRPYIKWSCEPARAQDVPAALARAYYLSMQKPCGPTFVSIPIDDWDVETEPVAARQVSSAFAPDPQALQKLADALNQSQHPALIVGPSVDRDGAWDEALELAERTQAAVWVSPMSGRCSFPEDHPLFAGFLPPVRRLLAAKLAGYDIVLVLGAPIFTYHVHSDGPVVPIGVQLWQMIDDPEAAAWAPVGTSLLSTLHLGLASLLELIGSSTRPSPPPLVRPSLPDQLDPIPPPFVLHTVAQMMPEDAVVVEEAPSHRNYLHDYLPIRHSNGFYTGASGGLGYSLPAAVGIALADPTRRVIGLLGDGSSMYSVQGLWTAAQHRLPITFLILNNREYTALKSFSTMLNVAEFPGMDLPGIDICTIARGYGCTVLYVDKACNLATALAQSFVTDGPVVIDVIVDRAAVVLYE